MNLNKVTLLGNLTRDPEKRTIPSGKSVVNFGVATNAVWTDANGQKQQKVEFHNIIAWDKLADICESYIKKGSKIYLEGKLQTSDWLANDGTKRYKTEIVMNNMIMLDNKGGGNTEGGTNNTYQQPSPQQDNNQVQQDTNPGEEEIKVEQIPF